MSKRHYYTLMASLPPLPRFDRADRLPINQERLNERMSMLEDDDAAVVRAAENYLHWNRQPVERTSAEVVEFYDQLIASSKDPTLNAMLEYRMTERTIIAALRRRLRGHPPPAAGDPWGVGPWVGHIERNWDAPDFRLSPVFPWLPEARRLLEEGEARELQRLLMGLIWDQLVRLVENRPFHFDALLCYLFRWDILRRWLSYEDTATARHRFRQLLHQVTADHHLEFAPPTSIAAS